MTTPPMFPFADLLPWTWALLAGLALRVAAALLQGRLRFGFTGRIRRADPGPAAARRCAREVWLERPGGVLLQGWLALPTGDGSPPSRLLLWFGGRGEHVAWTPDIAG